MTPWSMLHFYQKLTNLMGIELPRTSLWDTSTLPINTLSAGYLFSEKQEMPNDELIVPRFIALPGLTMFEFT
jgi:hypothetical protein